MASIVFKKPDRKQSPPKFRRNSVVLITQDGYAGPSRAWVVDVKPQSPQDWSYLLCEQANSLTLGWFPEKMLSKVPDERIGDVASPKIDEIYEPRTRHSGAKQSPPRPQTGRISTEASEKPPTYKWLVDCEIEEFMSQEYPERPRLEDLVFLRGNSVDAECCTCLEYTKDSDAALTVLEALNLALDSSGFADSFSASDYHLGKVRMTSTSTTPRLRKTSTRMLISVESTSTEEVASADLEAVNRFLVFLTSALRPVESEGLWLSAVETSIASGLRRLRMLPLKKVVQQSCWHVLFPRKVIVSASLLEPRHHRPIGLRADLPLLMQLCGIDVPVLEDGGLTLQGVYTILVPISRDEMNNVQWHLLYVDPDKEDVLESREELLLSQIPSVRLLISDIQEFETGTHFLGWTDSTIITLGTREQRYSTLRSSTARTKEKEAVESSTTLYVNLSFHGFGGGVSHTRKMGKTERNPFDNRERSLKNWLVSSKREQVLLHRPSRLQSWLVPKPAVLLHCAIAYIWNLSEEDPTFTHNWDQYYVSSGTQQKAYDALIRLTTAEASPSTSMSSVHPNSGSRVSEAPWKEIITTLLHMMSAIRRRSIVGRLNRKILGFELYDLIAQPQWFDLKESHISNTAFGSLGGWPRLLGDVPLVLFFEGINDPIISMHQKRRSNCSNRPRIGRDQNLMATTIGSLQDLAKRRGGINESGQVTETGYWHSPRDYSMFDDCSHPDCGSGKCDARQFIWPRPGIPPLPPELEDPERGIIFAAGTGSGFFESLIS